MLLHNENNKKITHCHFIILFLLLHIQATINSCQFDSYCEQIWKREKSCSTFFVHGLSFNLYSQLPARLYSFHLAVLFAQPSVPKWPYIGLGIHSGALFSRWLTLKNLCRNPPTCPLCLRKGMHCWDPGSPARLYVCHAGIKSSGRSRILTGGEIPQEQDGPDLPELSPPPVSLSNRRHVVLFLPRKSKYSLII